MSFWVSNPINRLGSVSISEVAYRETNGIPICPYCQEPTKRTGEAWGTCTLVYYEPTYDENGNNINPDRNVQTWTYHCCKCGRDYTVSGNYFDGWRYIEE